MFIVLPQDLRSYRTYIASMPNTFGPLAGIQQDQEKRACSRSPNAEAFRFCGAVKNSHMTGAWRRLRGASSRRDLRGEAKNALVLIGFWDKETQVRNVCATRA